MTEEQAKGLKLIEEIGDMLIDTIGEGSMKSTEYSKENKQVTVYCNDGTVHRITIQQIN